MKICDFTVPELNILLEKCNFTKEETVLFKLRAEGIPLETCAEIMNYSITTVKRKNKKINSKIERVREENLCI